MQQLRREDHIRRLQEQQDAAAALAAEKQREKEEKERQEKIKVNLLGRDFHSRHNSENKLEFVYSKSSYF